jgi:hypothetical protein
MKTENILLNQKYLKYQTKCGVLKAINEMKSIICNEEKKYR